MSQICQPIIQFQNLKTLLIDFSYNGVYDQSVALLGNTLEKLKNLISLSLQLHENSPQSEGHRLTDVCEFLSEFHILKNLFLGFQSNKFSDKDLSQMFSQLRKLKHLCKLRLDLSDNQVEEQGVLILGEQISQLKNLVSLNLNLNYNKLSDEELNCLFYHFSQIEALQKLSVDLISKTRKGVISHSNLSLLRPKLSNCVNLSILDLNLNSNKFQDQGAKVLGDALSNFGELEYLKLDISQNKVEEKGIQELTSKLAFLKGLSALKLSLIKNNLSDNISAELEKNLGNFQNLAKLFLDLNQNHIGVEKHQFIFQGLSRCQSLQNLHIDLSQIYINDQCCQSLGDEIGKCVNITSLNLNLKNNKIGDYGISKLSEGLTEFLNLQQLSLNLEENRIEDYGITQLGEGLARCHKIEDLSLNFNQNLKIADDGISSFNRDLQNLTNLIKLTLSLENTNLGDQGVYSIGEFILNLKNLQILSLSLFQLNLTCLGQGVAGYENLRDLSIHTTPNIYNQQNDTFNYEQGVKKIIILSSLNLKYECISQHEVYDIFLPQLENFLNITNLVISLRGLSFCDKGALVLSKALVQMKKLQNLNLDFGLQGVTDLGNGIQECKNILNLIIDLEFTKIDNDEKSKVCESITHREMLTNLKLNQQQLQL
ncbi:hypothetical protein ABPG72_005009 [Tetrahymena utriculariae]